MAKKTASRALIDIDISARRKTADELLKSTKTKYDSTKRSVRTLATEKETHRAVQLLERALRMKAAKNIYSVKWWEYERTWKMLEEERPDDEKWRANLPDTMSYATIKTAQAAFIDSEVVPVFSSKEGDDLMQANDQRDLYVDNAKKGGLKFQLYLARLDAMKLGTAFLFTFPHKDTRIQWEIDQFDPKTEKITYTRKTIDVFDDPKTIRVSPYLVLVDEQARADFRGTARDAFMIEIIPREEAILRYAHLMGGVEAFNTRIPTTQSLKALATGELQNRGVATTANNNTRDVSTRIYTFFAPIELALNMVELLHYFAVRPEDSYELLCNGQPVFVKTDTQPSPLPWIHKEIPITPIRYGLYSGDEFWGQGIIEQGRAETKQNRQYREMMNDRQAISLFSPVFSDVTDEIDKKFLKLKPLSIIRTRGGVPTQYKIPGITTADLQIAADHGTSHKRATGIDDTLIGSGSLQQYAQHRFTATAIAFMRQSAFLRLKDFQFLYKEALIDEVRLKSKLFEQYYCNPLKRASKETGEEGLKELASKAKEFSVISGNTYTKKKVTSTLFNGPIDHVDIDEQVLVPLTPAEQITKWSQVIRDMAPFVQAGVVDYDMEKMIVEYLKAMQVNPQKLSKDPDNEAISMADGEHQLLVSDNTSQVIFDKILKDGTPEVFLTAMHLKRHQQLLKTIDKDEVGKENLDRLIAHIGKDSKNYEDKMRKQAEQQKADPSKLSGQLGDFGAPNTAAGQGGAKPPSVSMNYKDAPDDVKRQIEEEIGLKPSSEPDKNSNAAKGPLPGSSVGAGYKAPGNSPDSMPPLMHDGNTAGL